MQLTLNLFVRSVAATCAMASGIASISSGFDTLGWDAPRWVAALHLSVGFLELLLGPLFVTSERAVVRRVFVGLLGLAALIDLSSYAQIPLMQHLLAPAALVASVVSLILRPRSPVVRE